MHACTYLCTYVCVYVSMWTLPTRAALKYLKKVMAVAKYIHTSDLHNLQLEVHQYSFIGRRTTQ